MFAAFWHRKMLATFGYITSSQKHLLGDFPASSSAAISLFSSVCRVSQFYCSLCSYVHTDDLPKKRRNVPNKRRRIRMRLRHSSTREIRWIDLRATWTRCILPSTVGLSARRRTADRYPTTLSAISPVWQQQIDVQNFKLFPLTTTAL